MMDFGLPCIWVEKFSDMRSQKILRPCKTAGNPWMPWNVYTNLLLFPVSLPVHLKEGVLYLAYLILKDGNIRQIRNGILNRQPAVTK